MPLTYKRHNLEPFVTHIFQQGVTMRKISDILKKLYGHHYTPQTISNMRKAMKEQVEGFKLFLLRRDTVSKEFIYIAVGIRQDEMDRKKCFPIQLHYSQFYAVKISNRIIGLTIRK